jgi:hypothetical protein
VPCYRHEGAKVADRYGAGAQGGVQVLHRLLIR